jgi:hypothetical protein
MAKRQMKNHIAPSRNTAHTSSPGKRAHLFKRKKIKNDLTCVAKSINLNTNEKIIRFRKSQTCEYCIISDGKILFQFSSSIRTDETVWSIGTSGVSLLKGCREVPNDVTHTGRKSCFYSQTPIEPCRANKRIFPLNGRLHKRCRIPIYKNFSKAIRCDGECGKSQKIVDIFIGNAPGHQGSNKLKFSSSTPARSDFYIFHPKTPQKQLTFDLNSTIIMSNERRAYFNPVFFIQSIPDTNTKKMSQIKSQGNTRKLRIEYHYDRLLSKKIQQVYQTLVPLELLFLGGRLRKCCKLDTETEIEIETEQEHHRQPLKLRIEKGGDFDEDSCDL